MNLTHPSRRECESYFQAAKQSYQPSYAPITPMAEPLNLSLKYGAFGGTRGLETVNPGLPFYMGIVGNDDASNGQKRSFADMDLTSQMDVSYAQNVVVEPQVDPNAYENQQQQQLLETERTIFVDIYSQTADATNALEIEKLKQEHEAMSRQLNNLQTQVRNFALDVLNTREADRRNLRSVMQAVQITLQILFSHVKTFGTTQPR